MNAQKRGAYIIASRNVLCRLLVIALMHRQSRHNQLMCDTWSHSGGFCARVPLLKDIKKTEAWQLQNMVALRNRY